MKTLKTLALAGAVSAGLLGSTGVMAFKDGPVGDTSIGEFDIRLLIEQQVRIWGFRDLVIGTVTGDAAGETDSQTVCVGSNSGRYSLSLNSLNSLNLNDGTNDIDYKITANAQGVISGGTGPLTYTWEGAIPGNPTFDFITTVTSFDDNTECTAGEQSLQLTAEIINTNEVSGAGTYTDTVTLTVAAR